MKVLEKASGYNKNTVFCVERKVVENMISININSIKIN
jgi:hypothetical protein